MTEKKNHEKNLTRLILSLLESYDSDISLLHAHERKWRTRPQVLSRSIKYSLLCVVVLSCSLKSCHALSTHQNALSYRTQQHYQRNSRLNFSPANEKSRNIVKEKLQQFQFSSSTRVDSVFDIHSNHKTGNDKSYDDNAEVTSYLRNNIKDAKSLEREIVRLGRKGHTEQALFLYYSTYQTSTHNLNRQDEKSNGQIHNIQTTTRLMNAAIDVCARARPPRMSEAFDLFDHAVNIDKRVTPNVFTFGALMSVCARERNPDRAMQVLEDMENIYDTVPNNVVYSTAISAAERSLPPRPEMALSLLRTMMDNSTLRRSKQFGGGFTIAYNTAISALARAGEYETAISLLEIDMPQNGVLPDEITFGTVMAACERCQKWELILKFAEKMEFDPSLSHLNLKMDGITITTVLKACQQLNLANRALRYLNKFKDLETNENTNEFENRKTRGKRRKGVRAQLKGPDDVAYCLAISACSRAGRIDDALNLLEEIPKHKRSVNAYTAVIQGYTIAGDYISAMNLLQVMEERDGVKPNVVTYSTVISACAAAVVQGMHSSEGDKNHNSVTEPLRCALNLLEDMKTREVNPNVITYNVIIKTCAEGLECEKAFQYMNELLATGLSPTIITFGTLMTACERIGDMASAGQVFSMMKKAEVEPNEIIYGAAISCCRKANHPERALLLLRKMIQSPNLHPNTAVYNTAMMALTADLEPGALVENTDDSQVQKNLERALKIFQIMTSTKHSTPVCRPNRQTFSILLRATTLARPPMAEEAEKLLRKMKQAGFSPGVEQYAAVVNAFERDSPAKPLKALRLMEEMSSEGFDFYENTVLNKTFKKLVKLANAMAGPDGEKKRISK